MRLHAPIHGGAASEPGDVLAGKYQLEQVLGQGGMGTVWRARHLGLDSPVAIKVLSATLEEGGLRERLLLEAKAARSVTHPAIVQVFDVEETDHGEPFIVMELLSGSSLGSLLALHGRLEAERAVQLLLPIAEGLQLAHARGLIHRDIKPDNIFVVDGEARVQPKLLDFGIVKMRRNELARNLTSAGAVLGSPDYMSPEQASGSEGLNHLSDVWAFSVVLYEAICGRPPFVAANYNALVFQILEEEPKTLHELGACDEALSAIVSRGLRKQPTQRFASMREMGQALADWLVRRGVTDDICGSSIETRWLRDVGPQAANGSWSAPEAPSGVRLRTVPTSASRAVPTPTHAHAPRARKWLLVPMTLLLGVGGSFAWPYAAKAVMSSHSTIPSLASTPKVRSAPRAPAAPLASFPRSSDAPIVSPESLELETPAPVDGSQSGTGLEAPRYPVRSAPRGAARNRSGDLLNPY